MRKKLLLLFGLFLVIFSQINIANSTDKKLPHTLWAWWGWAMFSFSISPYSDLWIVWTDMWELYRSTDLWASWETVNQRIFRYIASWYLSNYFWFSSDGKTVFGAILWCDPRISYDSWKTWNSMEKLKNLMPAWEDFEDCMTPKNGNRINYFLTDSTDENFVISAMWDWLIISKDKWRNWNRIEWVSWDSKWTFIDYSTSPHTIYHSSNNTIYKSTDWWNSFSIFTEDKNIKSFAWARDDNWLVLAYIKQKEGSTKSILKIKKDELGWETKFEDWLQYVKMAENNSKVIYITWDREESWSQTGTNIWKSIDSWNTWELIFNIYSKPHENLEASWVWLDIWYWDGGYRSFSINRRNPDIIWWTWNFFLHTTKDWWKTWQSPFTKFEGPWEIWPWKTWSSRWLEPTSCRKLKFHPKNPKLWYVWFADIKWKVTEDWWKTWRILSWRKTKRWKHLFNSFYDFAFDENNENIVYWATSKFHDSINISPKADPFVNTEDKIVWRWYILKSEDKWKTWTRLTPDNYEYNMPYLSVAYDTKNNIIYAWSQWRWVARSKDGWKTWEWITSWMADESLYPKMIAQIEIDPENWDVYALLKWDRLFWDHYRQVGWDLNELMKISNYWLVWIYRLKYGEDKWEFLKENLIMENINPKNWWPTGKNELLLYPHWFAIDWNDKSRNTMFMVDSKRRNLNVSWIWKTTDWWKNWHMKKRISLWKWVTINPNNSNEIHATWMSWQDEIWALYSKDGWETWEENNNLPVTSKFVNATIDPNNPDKIFYTTFWWWIRYANNPTYEIPDDISPIINLNWEAELTLDFWEAYDEFWATCTDNKDQVCKVIIWGDSVNTNEAWTYNITYNATDKAWNKATEIIRKVIVKEKVIPDTTAPIINLNWEAEITLNFWETYNELGASCSDNIDENCEVIIWGDIVNTNEAWTYNITYNATDKAWNKATEVTRKVIVKEKVVPDTTAPIISLNWEAEITLKFWETYNELWATCSDNIDENCEVIIWGDSVNINEAWTYNITYNATDEAWNKATEITRKVIVKEKVVNNRGKWSLSNNWNSFKVEKNNSVSKPKQEDKDNSKSNQKPKNNSASNSKEKNKDNSKSNLKPKPRKKSIYKTLYPYFDKRVILYLKDRKWNKYEIRKLKIWRYYLLFNEDKLLYRKIFRSIFRAINHINSTNKKFYIERNYK